MIEVLCDNSKPSSEKIGSALSDNSEYPLLQPQAVKVIKFARPARFNISNSLDFRTTSPKRGLKGTVPNFQPFSQKCGSKSVFCYRLPSL